ncbi:MFS transporter [Tetragenococcus solitarius]|uniref:MFS transporter n=2 Tax=Tetragenococcus solitarius TaxID=71453 RepID=A0ABN3YB16_9ENTE
MIMSSSFKNPSSLMTKFAILSISLLLISSNSINGALPQIKNALDISQTQVETLSTISAVSVTIFVLFSNLVVNKLGMKRTIVVGLILAGIGGILPAFTNSYMAMLISRIIMGAGLGMYNSLAVTIINRVYEDNKSTEATLLGIRGSMEQIGQAVLTFIAGLLLNIGWRYSFIIYLAAFPIAILFAMFVPDVKTDVEKAESNTSERMNPVVYLWMLFAILINSNANAVSVRFPSLATTYFGDDFNASNYLAVIPLIAIISGFVFGSIFRRLGSKTLYLGITVLIISNLFISLSDGNFVFMLLGVFLSSVPGTWCLPYIFSILGRITPKSTQTFANSLIFVGCNLGLFMVPYILNVFQRISPSNDLSSPFLIYAIVLVVLMVIMFIGSRAKKNTNE